MCWLCITTLTATAAAVVESLDRVARQNHNTNQLTVVLLQQYFTRDLRSVIDH